MGILIMNNYLSIVRRADFIDLFKYGHFNIFHVVKFSGNIEEYANDDLLFEHLTSRMNMYEYSYEYLIIHFSSESETSSFTTINIKDVQNLFAFNEEAKKEMSIRFDSRIQIHISPWAEKFDKLHKKLLFNQSMLGVNNIWAIFDLPIEDITKCREIISDHTISEVFRQFYSNESISGKLPLWNYLLRYERHSFYPKNMRGFFCDFIHIVCNWKSGKTIDEDVAETTNIYPKIINSIDDKFQTLVDVVNNSPLAPLTQSATNCEFFKVAPLFLFLKDKFIEGMEHRPTKDYISYIKSFGLEGKLALYLLGVILGYDKTYEAFYESTNLSFFKKQVEYPKEANNEIPINIVSENKSIDNNATMDSIVSTNISQQDLLFPTGSDSSNPHPIMWMRKGNDIRPIMSKEEAKSLTNYKQVRTFNELVLKSIESWGYNPEEEKLRFSNSRVKKKN